MIRTLQIKRCGENLLEEGADRPACERPLVACHQLLQHLFFPFGIEFRHTLLFFYSSNFLYDLGPLGD
ncbi:hypothetical protein D3C73_927330 [compost metagenome]